MDDAQIEKLLALRYEIDEVDNKMHDLLMHRAYLASEIGKLKKESGVVPDILHPVREAQIVRRLWNRHNGELDKRVVSQIWREIISACVNVQKPMNVAVYMPRSDCKNMALARHYFGSCTAIVPCRSESLVLKELSEGDANIGVFSLGGVGEVCWWYSIAQENKRTFSVFAQLPFAENIPDLSGRTAYAVGRVAPEAGEDMNSLLFVETDGMLSLSTLDLVLKAAGVPTLAVCDTYSPDLTRKAYLIEVSGFFAENDQRLSAVADKEKERIVMMRVIGNYPVPLK